MNGSKPIVPAFAAETDSVNAPVPTGSRDMLPEETSEMREISAALLAVFARAGYGEVATPAFEYEETMRLAGESVTRGAYRVPDKDGSLLVARFDSTIPIARLAAARYRDAEPPLRFCYFQSIYRPVEPKRGKSREFLQVGMELMGVDGPEGDAEVIRLLDVALSAAGLDEFLIAIGDSTFFTERLADAGGVTAETRDAVLYELRTRDLVGLRRELDAARIGQTTRDELLAIAGGRGDREMLERHGAARLVELDDHLRTEGTCDRVIYDLGLARAPAYYTGAVIEVFVPTDGLPLGGGGRYDGLVGRFGRDLTACGFALNMERLHLAVLAQRNGGGATR